MNKRWLGTMVARDREHMHLLQWVRIQLRGYLRFTRLD